MTIGSSFPSDAEPAKVVVPTVGTLDDPAPSFFSANGAGEGGLAAASDVWLDPTSTRFSLGFGVVVSFVETDVLGTPAPTWTKEGNRVQGLAHHVHVVDVGTGERDRQRDTLAVGQNVTFCAEFSTIGWIGAGEVPPFGAFTLALSNDAQSHSMPTFSS